MRAISTKVEHVRTLVANPTSYCYPLDTWVQHEGVPPDKLKACPDYNKWDLGLHQIGSLPEYVNYSLAKTNATGTLVPTLLGLNVSYLLGDMDNCTDKTAKGCSGYVQPTDCGVELQGHSRYMRGAQYYQWLMGTGKTHKYQFNHSLVSVPNVGHNGTQMFRSAATSLGPFLFLFQVKRAPTTNLGPCPFSLFQFIRAPCDLFVGLYTTLAVLSSDRSVLLAVLLALLQCVYTQVTGSH